MNGVGKLLVGVLYVCMVGYGVLCAMNALGATL